MKGGTQTCVRCLSPALLTLAVLCGSPLFAQQARREHRSHAAQRLARLRRPGRPALAAPPESEPQDWNQIVAKATLASDPNALNTVHLQAKEWWQKSNGAVSDRETSRVMFYKSVELEVTVSKDGEPVSAYKRFMEQHDLAQAQKRIDKRWKGPMDDGRLVRIADSIVSLPKLLQHYQWQHLGADNVEGQPCQVFRFSARPGDPANSRMVHLMQLMQGRLWMDPQSGQILKVTFHNNQPVKIGFGMLANFDHISGTFTMQRSGNAWVWGKTVIHLSGRELWHTKNGTLVKTYVVR